MLRSLALAASGVVIASGMIFGSGVATAQELSCKTFTSGTNSSYYASCSSGPGTSYRSFIRCTNIPLLYRYGPEQQYNPRQGSFVACTGDGEIIEKGVQTS